MKIKRFDDKFVNGFIGGIIAALITGPISFAAKHFNFTELELADFSGILTLHKVPESLAENIFAAGVDMMVSGALGIIFAFMVPYIGRRYLLFKGWFILGALWYLYYPLITMAMLDDVHINVQTHTINGIIAGLFGIVLAQAYYWLHPDIQVKAHSSKDAKRHGLENNEFAEEIASPIPVHPPFSAPTATLPPAVPMSLTVTPVNPSWSKKGLIKAAKVMADSVTLEWPPASDNTGQIKYRVLVNDVFVGETDETTFIVQSLEPSTSYTFSIVAEDEAGNRTEFQRGKKVRTRRGKKGK
jgi:hypothetical protein